MLLIYCSCSYQNNLETNLQILMKNFISKQQTWFQENVFFYITFNKIRLTKTRKFKCVSVFDTNRVIKLDIKNASSYKNLKIKKDLKTFSEQFNKNHMINIPDFPKYFLFI